MDRCRVSEDLQLYETEQSLLLDQCEMNRSEIVYQLSDRYSRSIDSAMNIADRIVKTDDASHLLASILISAINDPDETIIALRQFASKQFDEYASEHVNISGYTSIESLPVIHAEDPDDSIRALRMLCELEQ